MKTLLRFAAVLGLVLTGVVGFTNAAVAQNNPEGSAYANVVVCWNEECGVINPDGMEGALITSYDAAGIEIDSCAVEVFASGMNGCVLTMHDGSGSYSVENLTAGYTLLSEEPEVLESESHGTQLVWYAVAPPEDTVIEDPIDELPEVGVGSGIPGQAGFLAAAAVGIVLMALGATGLRGYGSES